MRAPLLVALVVGPAACSAPAPQRSSAVPTIAPAPAAVAPPAHSAQPGAAAIRARPAVGPWFSPCEHAAAEVLEDADRNLELYGPPTAARLSELRDDVIARLSRMRESAVVLDRTPSEAGRRELVADCQKVMAKAAPVFAPRWCGSGGNNERPWR